MYGTVYDALVYPNRFYLWLMMPVILGLTTNLLKDYSKTKLVICALSVVSFLFIHQSGFLFYFIIFGGVLLIVLIKKEYKLFRSILILFGLIIITSLPFLLIKLSGNIQFITSSSDQIWHNHYKFFYLTNDFFAFSYSKYFISEMWYGIIISLISLFYILIKKDHTDKFIYYLIIPSFFLPFLIIFNPFLVPYLSKLISYVAIVRMFRIPMYFLAFAMFLWFIFKKIDEKYNSKIIYALMMSLLIIIGFNFFPNFSKNGF